MPEERKEPSRNIVILLAVIAVVISVGGTWLVLSQVSSLQGLQTSQEAKLTSQKGFSEQSALQATQSTGTKASAQIVLDIKPPSKTKG